MILLMAGILWFLLGTASRELFPFIQVWAPPWSWREASYPLMIAASILGAAAILPPSHIRRTLRLPGLIALWLWSAAHLLSNGDLFSILYFAAPALWAAWRFSRPGQTQPAAGSRLSVQWDVAAILLGLTCWTVLFLGHGEFFGAGLDLWFLA